MAINCTFELINEKIYNKFLINYDDFINFCNSSFKINDADYYFIFYDGMEKYIIKNKEDYKKSIKSLFQKKKKLNIKNLTIVVKIINKKINEDKIKEENEFINKIYNEMEKKILSLEEQLNEKNNEIDNLKSKIENLKLNNSNNNIKFDIEEYRNNLNEINKISINKINENLKKMLDNQIDNLKKDLTNTLIKENEKIINEQLQSLNEIENQRSLFYEQEFSKINNPKSLKIENSNEKINEGIKCHNCSKDITGIRNKYKDFEYYLCEKCEKLNINEDIHDKNHSLINFSNINQNNNINMSNNFNSEINDTIKLKKNKIEQNNNIINPNISNIKNNNKNMKYDDDLMDNYDSILISSEKNNLLLAQTKDMLFFQEEIKKDFQIPKNSIIKENDSEIEEEDFINDNNLYSYDIEKRDLYFPFIKRNQSYIQIKLKIINNGENQWIKDKTKLICNSESNLNIYDINLNPLQKNNSQEINILIDRLDELNEGEYKIILDFVVNKKKFGEPIIIRLECKINENEELIEKFRKNFDLYDNTYSDEQILNVLVNCDLNFEKAFNALIDL